MMEPRLENEFGALERLLRRARLWRELAVCWAALAVVALAFFLIHGFTGWHSRTVNLIVLLAGIVATLALFVRASLQPKNFNALVTALERKHPEIRPLLATAFEQQANPESGQFHFLQLRVIDEALTHAQRFVWTQSIAQKLALARIATVFAATAFVICFFLNQPDFHFASSPWFGDELTVTPGNTEVERGAGLVISARFNHHPPLEATLVVVSTSGKTQRIPLERHLADPVFGASLLEVSEDALYHIEYAQKKSDDYKIHVFDYPALSRADASLQFPAYTGLTNKTIPDTRRVSAVEGTLLSYTLELNKPVVKAQLVGKEQTLALAVQTNAVALLNNFILTNSDRYLLELVDADGRTNKFPTDFVLQALPNREPDLKVIFPRGDPRVSSLQEIQLQAEATDDFGVLKYGVGFGVAGAEPKFVELGETIPANEKKQFTRLIPLEQLGVAEDDVVSYFAWADDYGPDGKVRRTFSDMFFAEVRPFEQIFRADQSGAGESGQQGQQQQRNPGTKLADLQKQIVIATWKLQREKNNFTPASQP